MSQVTSEMYAKLHSYVADVAQALEKHASAQHMKKQLEYVLTTAQDFYKYLGFEGTSATVDNVRVEVGREEQEAVSTPRWLVGMAMQLLNKFNSLSTYLTSTLHGATTAASASRMIKSLQARWKNVYQKMYESLPVAEYKGLEESRNDKSRGTFTDAVSGIAETAKLQAEQPAGSRQAENLRVCTDSMEQSSVEAENRHSLETIREDSCEDQQSTELQSASREVREQDSPRPRSWISFLLKRP